MYVIISLASILSLVTKQQFFQVFHQSLLFVCVAQVQIYQRHSFFRGTEGWIIQNGIPGEHIQVSWNRSSDAYKRYPLPTKLHAAHCMSSAFTTILICCIFVFFLNRYHFVGRFGWAETVFSLRILVAGDRCNIRSPHVWIKIVLGYRTLAGEFCVVNREFSNLWCPMNTLQRALFLLDFDRFLHTIVKWNSLHAKQVAYQVLLVVCLNRYLGGISL